MMLIFDCGRGFWLFPRITKHGMLLRFMWLWFGVQFYPQQFALFLESYREVAFEEGRKSAKETGDE